MLKLLKRIDCANSFNCDGLQETVDIINNNLEILADLEGIDIEKPLQPPVSASISATTSDTLYRPVSVTYSSLISKLFATDGYNTNGQYVIDPETLDVNQYGATSSSAPWNDADFPVRSYSFQMSSDGKKGVIEDGDNSNVRRKILRFLKYDETDGVLKVSGTTDEASRQKYAMLKMSSDGRVFIGADRTDDSGAGTRIFVMNEDHTAIMAEHKIINGANVFGTIPGDHSAAFVCDIADGTVHRTDLEIDLSTGDITSNINWQPVELIGTPSDITSSFGKGIGISNDQNLLTISDCVYDSNKGALFLYWKTDDLKYTLFATILGSDFPNSTKPYMFGYGVPHIAPDGNTIFTGGWGSSSSSSYYSYLAKIELQR